MCEYDIRGWIAPTVITSLLTKTSAVSNELPGIVIKVLNYDPDSSHESVINLQPSKSLLHRGLLVLNTIIATNIAYYKADLTFFYIHTDLQRARFNFECGK